MRRALEAPYIALSALPERYLGAPFLGAVGQDAPLQGGYLPPAGGALLRESCLTVVMLAAAKATDAHMASVRRGVRKRPRVQYDPSPGAARHPLPTTSSPQLRPFSYAAARIFM